jgi:oxygen-dependent protoporphyrinogen oxidase
MKKIVILGAGISGLATGWFLKQKWGNQIDLTILEKSVRAGGWIRTLESGAFLFEAGPRGFSPKGKGEATLELVKGLQLQDKLVPARKGSNNRYIYLNGRLQAFGLGFLLKQGLISAAMHDLWASKTSQEDESIANFVSRRFNSRLAETVMDPLTKGIFGGNMHNLSMRSCFPVLWKLEQEHQSVIRGLLAIRKKKKSPNVSSYTFQDGMETLTRRLAEELQSSLKLEHTIHSLDEIVADAIISTVPIYALAPLVACADPCSYITLSLVHLGWNRNILPKRGYGFLVPAIEQGDILGMTWDSEVFPKESQTRVCVMIEGKEKEEELIKKALNSMKMYLGVEIPPEVTHVTIADRAIHQYTLGHENRIEFFKKQLPQHMKVIGTGFSGPGVNDSIFAARSLVQDFAF